MIDSYSNQFKEINFSYLIIVITLANNINYHVMQTALKL